MNSNRMSRINWKRGLWRLYGAFAASWLIVSSSIVVYVSLDSARSQAQLARTDALANLAPFSPDSAIEILEEAAPAGLPPDAVEVAAPGSQPPPDAETLAAHRQETHSTKLSPKQGFDFDKAAEQYRQTHPPKLPPGHIQMPDVFVPETAIDPADRTGRFDANGNPVRRLAMLRSDIDTVSPRVFHFHPGTSDAGIRKYLEPKLAIERMRVEAADREKIEAANLAASFPRQFLRQLCPQLIGERWMGVNAFIFGPPALLLIIGLTIAWIIKGFSTTNAGA